MNKYISRGPVVIFKGCDIVELENQILEETTRRIEKLYPYKQVKSATTIFVAEVSEFVITVVYEK